MICVDASRNAVTCIGRLGENEARVIRINVSSIVRQFPGASFTVLNKRPGDPDAYPVPAAYVAMDGENVMWTVTSGDLTREGIGQFEVRASVGGTVVKTIIYTSRIEHALDGSGTVPEPWESWVEEVTDAADRAETAKDAAEDAAERAEAAAAGVIDDTAGAGVTNKTWSADKLVNWVATLAEVQEIIDSYDGEDEDGVIVEMNRITGGFQSEMDASEIAEAFTSGKNIVLHFQPSGQSPDAYAQLVYYAGTNENYDTEAWKIDSYGTTTSQSYNIRGQLNEPRVIDGKLVIYFAD